MADCLPKQEHQLSNSIPNDIPYFTRLSDGIPLFTSCICPYISRTDTGQSIFSHSSEEILMPECLKHSMAK